MKTWKIAAIIYSIVGWVFITTVNLDGSGDSSPYKEKTLAGLKKSPAQVVQPPMPIGYMPMRSLTYPSKILGFYSPYKRFMKSWPRPDRFQKPDHDSLFFAAETLNLSDPLFLGLR